MSTIKKCIKCGIGKPATNEFFVKMKNGICGTCKICGNAISRERHKAHKEEEKTYRKEYNEINEETLCAKSREYRKHNKVAVSTYNRKYRGENREAANAYNKAYYSENKESLNADKKIYRENNKDAIKYYAKEYRENNSFLVNEWRKNNSSYNKEYYQANKEKITISIKEYAKTHKPMRVMINQRRRARKRNLPNTLTLLQWEQAKKYFNNECAYCGKDSSLTQDHYYPLHLGGEYTVLNIIPACRRCNSSKGTKMSSKWFSLQTYYDRKREDRILTYLGYKDSVQQLSFV